jgi:hypothetical protein
MKTLLGLTLLLGACNTIPSPLPTLKDSAPDVIDRDAELDVRTPVVEFSDACDDGTCRVAQNNCPYDMVLVNPQLPWSLPNTIDRSKFDEADFAFDPSEVKGPYCVDQFEWENVKGGKPIVGVSAQYAEQACASVGKRLLTHSEWVISCMSSTPTLYGYGNAYVRGQCNDNKVWRAPNWGLMSNPSLWRREVERLYQADPSGSHELCKSIWDGGEVFDMVANAGEVVADSKAKWGYVMMGCSDIGCFRSEYPSCIYSNRNHDFRNFASYEMSFRCQKDVPQK